MSHEVYNQSEIKKDIDFINIVKKLIADICEDEGLYNIKKNTCFIENISPFLNKSLEEDETSSVIENIELQLGNIQNDLPDIANIFESKEEEDLGDEKDSNEAVSLSRLEILNILDCIINKNVEIASIKQGFIIPFISSLDSDKVFKYFMKNENINMNDFKIMSELLNNNNKLLTLFIADHKPQQMINVKDEMLKFLDELLSGGVESELSIKVLDMFFLNVDDDDKNNNYDKIYENFTEHENYYVYKPFYDLIINKKNDNGEYYFDKYIIEKVDHLIMINKTKNKNAGLVISCLIHAFNFHFMSYFDKEQKEEIIKRLSSKENVYLLPFANDTYFPLYYFSIDRKEKFITKIDFDDKNKDDGIFTDKLNFSSELIEQVLAKKIKGLYVNKNIAENVNRIEYNEELEQWYDNFETINPEEEYKEESKKLYENICKMDSDDIIKLSNILKEEYSTKDKAYKDYDRTVKNSNHIIYLTTKSFFIFQNAIISLVINNDDYDSKLIYRRHYSTKMFLSTLLMNIKDKNAYDKIVIINRLKEKMNQLQRNMLEELLFFIDIYKNENLCKINWGDNNLVKIKLFSKKDVIKKMSSLPQKEGLEDERIEIYNKILENNEYRIKIKNDKLLENIEGLKKEFPHFKKFLEYVEKNAKLSKIGNNTFYIPPTILLGPPGIGKTHFVKTLTEKINGTHTIINMESVESTFKLTGLNYGYSTSSAGMIFDDIMKTKYANHIFVLDEIDKIKNNQNVKDDVLLTLVEPINAKEFKDSYMDFPMDITNVVWIATANYASQISAPIKSRFQTFNIDYPDFEEKKVIIANIYKYLLKKESWGSKFNEVMNDKCICLLAESFNSVRELRKILLDLCSNNIDRIPETNDLREIEILDFPKKITNVQPWNKRK